VNLFEIDQNSIYFCIGDVSGKGMNAALLMSKAASLFRCLGKTIPHPGILLANINNEIYDTATHGMFVTMACGIYDLDTGSVRIANAGHLPVLIHNSNNDFDEVGASSAPLGIMPLESKKDAIPETEFNLGTATLYLYTDGIIEGKRSDRSIIGTEGLKELIKKNADVPAQKRIENIISVLDPDKHKLHDDLTLLVLENKNHL